MSDDDVCRIPLVGGFIAGVCLGVAACIGYQKLEKQGKVDRVKEVILDIQNKMKNKEIKE